MYVRSAADVWDVETNWGYGWEAECTEYTLAEAKAQYKTYRDNAYGRFSVRLKKRREKIA